VIKVYTSSVIDAPADAVWAQIRDFNGLPKWTPFVAESRIEGNQPADKVGCVRNFRLKDGSTIREQLLTLSDFDFQCTYSILESPMGVENYVATLEADAGDRRQSQLRRVVGGVRLRAGARAGTVAAGRAAGVPGRLRLAQGAVPALMAA
jgi:hypothetical protein